MVTRAPLDRQTRIRKRVITIGLYLVILVGLAWFFESQSTTTIIFVRHAEKETTGEDPGLTEAGKARARELNRIMQIVDVDRSVDEVFSTQFRRTQETVRPLAVSLGKDVHPYDASDTVGVLETILSEHRGKISLVAAHSNTIRPMIEELGGSKLLPDIEENEYDNIYVVVIPWFGKVKTLRFTYGERY
ncbi:MAG: histidine phosphatase family protein, partial [Pseudomonadota bacterium]